MTTTTMQPIDLSKLPEGDTYYIDRDNCIRGYPSRVYIHKSAGLHETALNHGVGSTERVTDRAGAIAHIRKMGWPTINGVSHTVTLQPTAKPVADEKPAVTPEPAKWVPKVGEMVAIDGEDNAVVIAIDGDYAWVKGNETWKRWTERIDDLSPIPPAPKVKRYEAVAYDFMVPLISIDGKVELDRERIALDWLQSNMGSGAITADIASITSRLAEIERGEP